MIRSYDGLYLPSATSERIWVSTLEGQSVASEVPIKGETGERVTQQTDTLPGYV
ncbi:hypothetical protein [Micromonospora sp. NPDC049662]|uniref:hypothetical protein n=1 Tax=Micromonospora sp. NPDC049662 TaxID=3155397 RepID=UPI0034298243